jgi:hypothetical protein
MTKCPFYGIPDFRMPPETFSDGIVGSDKCPENFPDGTVGLDSCPEIFAVA